MDRAGAERESVAEFVRKVVALLLRREREDTIVSERGAELRRVVVEPFLHRLFEKIDDNFCARFERHSKNISRAAR